MMNVEDQSTVSRTYGDGSAAVARGTVPWGEADLDALKAWQNAMGVRCGDDFTVFAEDILG